MIKCVRISCNKPSEKTFFEVIAKAASKLTIEGYIQQTSENVFIIACGPKENIDIFIDGIYKLGVTTMPKSNFSMEVEPFYKEKDYRGVFRLIE